MYLDNLSLARFCTPSGLLGYAKLWSGMSDKLKGRMASGAGDYTVGSATHRKVLEMKVPWHRWTKKLSEEEKYQITSWAFSYFMKSSLTVQDALMEAVKKVKPDKVDKSGRLTLGDVEIQELQARVKNML
jgi:hypothetical protein